MKCQQLTQQSLANNVPHIATDLPCLECALHNEETQKLNDKIKEQNEVIRMLDSNLTHLKNNNIRVAEMLQKKEKECDQAESENRELKRCLEEAQQIIERQKSIANNKIETETDIETENQEPVQKEE